MARTNVSEWLRNKTSVEQGFSLKTSSITTCIYKNDTYGSKLLNATIFDYPVHVFPLQVSLVALISGILQLLLKPLGVSPVLPLIVGGTVVGKSGFGKINDFRRILFPPEAGITLIETLGWFGCMFYLFLVGVKMDVSILMRSSKKERAIGILSFIMPMLFTVPLSFSVRQFFHLDEFKNYDRSKNVPIYAIAVMQSTTSFHVIASFLADLKILNTELGRLAISASTISGLCSWISIGLLFVINSKENWYKFALSAVAQIIFIVVVLRKFVTWIIKQTPQGEPVKEIYMFFIYVMILGTAYVGELYGQHCLFGPLILGLAIPDGPPLGSSLANKLDSFVLGMLLPLFFASVGFKVDLISGIPNPHWRVVLLYSLLGSFGKVIGTIIPCMFYQIPLQEAVMLGSILSTVGIFDIQTYLSAYTDEIIDKNYFTLLVVNTALLAGVTSPLVYFLYKPSRSYIFYKKRTIQNVKRNAELRMLICIFEEDNVPTMVNILEASNPNRENPIVVYLLHLVELIGRSTPLLINHKISEKQFDESSQSHPIINSFKIYEKKNPGVVFVQPFTAITPFVSASDDIFTVATDRRTSFIVIPFHKQWTIDGTTQTGKWRNTNKKLLRQAPCSVGILIDRGGLKGARSVLSSWSTYTVGVIFLGDGDDREAICYAMRMAGHPNVYLTVYRLVLSDNTTIEVTEKMLDANLINEYRVNCMDNVRNQYLEEVVTDYVGIISVIRSLESAYDLILVGRSHNSYSHLFSSFMEWNEYPELGFFGDMFASSDFKGDSSVLVVQEHACVSTNKKPNSFNKARKSTTDMELTGNCV